MSKIEILMEELEGAGWDLADYDIYWCHSCQHMYSSEGFCSRCGTQLTAKKPKTIDLLQHALKKAGYE